MVLGIAGLILVTTFLLCLLPGYGTASATAGLRAFLAAADETSGSITVSVPADADDPAAQERAAAALFDARFAGLPILVTAPETGTPGVAGWTISPDAGAVRPAQVPALLAAMRTLPEAAKLDLGDRATVSGDLADTLATVQRSRQAADAVSVVPILLMAAISLVMLIQLGTLLALDRRSETALVRSRGAAAGQLVRLAVLEALALVVPAAAIGLGVAAAVLAGAGGSIGSAWLLAPAVAVVATVVIVVPAARQAGRPADRQEIDNSGRTRSLVTGSTALLVIAGAAVALWRFDRNGSAIVLDADGTSHVDPIAAMAPALVLIAAALVAAAVFDAGAFGAQRLVALTRTGAGTVLAARQVARRAVLFGVAVLMTALAVGGTGLAAGFAATQRQAQELTDVLRNGAPIRVVQPPEDPVRTRPYDSLSGRLLALPEVGTAAASIRRPASLGALDVSLTGTEADLLAELLPASRAFDPAAVGARIGVTPTGVPLPAGTTALLLPVEFAAGWLAEPSDASGVTTDLPVSVWIADPLGAVRPVPAGSVRAAAGTNAQAGAGQAAVTVLRIPLPGLSDGSRLVAIDVRNPTGYPPTAARLVVGRPSAETAAGSMDLDLAGWTVPALGAGSEFDVLPSDELVFDDPDARWPAVAGWSGTFPANRQETVRLTPPPAGATAGGAAPPLPVAISADVAVAADLSVDDLVTVALDGARSVPAVVAVISPVLPGDGNGELAGMEVLADLDGLSAALLHDTIDLPAAQDVLVVPARGTTQAAAVSAIRAAVPADSAVLAAENRSAQALLEPAAASLWLGALGAMALAAVGTGCVIAILSRERAGEAVVLRAVGIPAARQGRSRRRELYAVSVAGWLLGLGVAAVAVLTCIPGLAGSAVVDPVGADAVIAFDLVPAWWLLAANVAAVLVLIVVHGHRVRVATLRSIPSGSDR